MKPFLAKSICALVKNKTKRQIIYGLLVGKNTMGGGNRQF